MYIFTEHKEPNEFYRATLPKLQEAQALVAASEDKVSVVVEQQRSVHGSCSVLAKIKKRKGHARNKSNKKSCPSSPVPSTETVELRDSENDTESDE